MNPLSRDVGPLVDWDTIGRPRFDRLVEALIVYQHPDGSDVQIVNGVSGDGLSSEGKWSGAFWRILARPAVPAQEDGAGGRAARAVVPGAGRAAGAGQMVPSKE